MIGTSADIINSFWSHAFLFVLCHEPYRYFPGRISRTNGDGTYDIHYDDGETELSVLPEYIKALVADSQSAAQISAGSNSASALREGDKIEARYKGRER